MSKIMERPILMNGEMVRATLEDRKTQTRRLLGGYIEPHPVVEGGLVWTNGRKRQFWLNCQPDHPQHISKAGVYSVGQRLWVRETWSVCLPTGDCAETISDAKEWHPSSPGYSGNHHGEARYAATDGLPDADARWFPSIHMPRWASRLTLEVTDVRVERLQAITGADAMAEGARRFDRGSVAPSFMGSDGPGWSMGTPASFGETLGSAQMAFANLWENLYGEIASWDSNPWIWRVAFRRLEQP